MAGSGLRVIDLDAASSLSVGYSGAKFSSAYCPPELVYLDEASQKCSIKSFKTDGEGKAISIGLPYSLVPASYAHDAWSLGITLYQLFTGVAFFNANDEENVDEADMQHTLLFTDEFRKGKLLRIVHPEARNMISQVCECAFFSL